MPTAKKLSLKPVAAALLAAGTVVLPPVSFAAEPSVLEEVVVTARKREERLQDLSAAVSVLSGGTLRDRIINDVRDIGNIAPSVNVGEVIGIMKINMRGLSNTTVVRGEDSEVVLHVDGAVISRVEAQSTAFFDLDRIEVLRGPQGTLYGRNSTGGTINLITAKPTEEVSGYVNATVGNYSLTKFETAVAGPLSDRVLGRVALVSAARNGYSRNIADNGNDFNDLKRWAARAHLQFNITDDVRFLLTGEYSDQNDSSGHLTFLDTIYSGVDPPYGTSGFSDPNSRDGALSTQPQMERTTKSVTGTLDWQFTDKLSLRSISNYRKLDFFNWSDLDVSSISYVDVGLPMEDEQYSQELQLTYDGDKLHALAGVFYYKEKFSGTTDVYLRFANSLLFQFVGESNTEAISPFWNASYDFNDRFSIRLGGRLNTEDRDFQNLRFLGGNQTGQLADKRSFNEYTGEYGLDFHFNENAMVYYTFSQGFRSGAALVMQIDSPIIRPTTVDNHEVGFKFQTNDGRFTTSIVAFDATVNDLQRSQATEIRNEQGEVIGAALRINNISEMDVRGVELEANWIPLDPLRISATLVHLDAEFKDFLTVDPFVQVPPGQSPAFVQVAGNTPRLTPDWRGHLHGEYAFSLANQGTLTAGVDLNYIGKQYFDEFNREPFVEDPYTLVDASLAYRPAAGNWSVTLWGKNLGGEKRLYDTNFSVFGGIKNKFVIDPLTFGLTASYTF